MAPSKVKATYTRDQRELSLLVYADAKGHTSAVLSWRYCQAGDERKVEAELGRWEWPGAINERRHAIWCLIWIAKRLADQGENPVPNV